MYKSQNDVFWDSASISLSEFILHLSQFCQESVTEDLYLVTFDLCMVVYK